MDPLQWMGAVRMRFQTADKTMTVIHSTPVHTSYETKRCMFVINSILRHVLLQTIILLSPVRTSSLQNQRRNMHRSSTVYKQKQSNKSIGGCWCERTTGTFSLDEALLWIMDLWILAKSDSLKSKRLLRWICLLHCIVKVVHKLLIDGLDSCGLLVDYCYVFISCFFYSHSDGTHSLQRIHWWTNEAILSFSKSVLMKKQTHLHFGWPKGKFLFLDELLL